MANTEKIVVQVVVQGEKDLQRLEKRTGTTTKSFGRMAAGILGAVTAFRQIVGIVGSALKTFREFERTVQSCFLSRNLVLRRRQFTLPFPLPR